MAIHEICSGLGCKRRVCFGVEKLECWKDRLVERHRIEIK